MYTPDQGLQSYIIGGVRKAKSRQANVFNPMNILEFVSYPNENRLSRIKEAGYAITYSRLNFDVIRSSIAMFLIDLSRNSIKESESNPELYKFLKNYLIAVDEGEIELKYVPHFFALDLAKYLGFEPSANFSALNQYFDLREGAFIDNNVVHQNILNESLSKSMFELIAKNEKVNLNKAQRSDLLDRILDYYKLHIEGFKDLKSLSVLRSILS